MTVRAVESQTRETTAEVPQVLVYEMVRGKPVYYRGYEHVLAGELPPEAVMGSGKLHAWLVILLGSLLKAMLDDSRYMVLGGEVGFWIHPGHWRVLDVAVFDRAALEREGLNAEYVRTPPLLVIEVHTKADPGPEGDLFAYVMEKIQDLLTAGVGQVLWIFFHPRKVWVCQRGKPWQIVDWDTDIPLVVGDVTLNLARLLEEAGVKLEEHLNPEEELPKEEDR